MLDLMPKQFIDKGLSLYPDSVLVEETDNYYFINLNSMDASIYFSQNQINYLKMHGLEDRTWCTATPNKEHNHFNYYKTPETLFILVQSKTNLFNVEVILIDLLAPLEFALEYVSIYNIHRPLTSKKEEQYSVAKSLWEEFHIDIVYDSDITVEPIKEQKESVSMTNYLIEASKVPNSNFMDSYISHSDFKKIVEHYGLQSKWELYSNVDAWNKLKANNIIVWVYVLIRDYNVSNVFLVTKKNGNIIQALDSNGDAVTIDILNDLLTDFNDEEVLEEVKKKKKEYSDKMESCVKGVKEKEGEDGKYNPWAVCTASMKKAGNPIYKEAKQLNEGEVVLYCPNSKDRYRAIIDEVCGNDKFNLTIETTVNNKQVLKKVIATSNQIINENINVAKREKLMESFDPALAMYSVLIPMAIWALYDITKDFGKYVSYSEFKLYPKEKKIKILEDALQNLKTEYNKDNFEDFIYYYVDALKVRFPNVTKAILNLIGKLADKKDLYDIMISHLENKLNFLKGEPKTAIKEALLQQEVFSNDVLMAYEYVLSVVNELGNEGINFMIDSISNESSEMAKISALPVNKWVSITFYPKAEEDFKKIFQKEWELLDMGIVFDNSTDLGVVEWVLDWDFQTKNFNNRDEIEKDKEFSHNMHELDSELELNKPLPRN